MIHYIMSIVTAISFVATVVVALSLKECDDNHDEILFGFKIIAVTATVTLIGVYLVCVKGI